MDLVVSVYGTTATFPREERIGLTAQLRSCAVSVPSNIAEGHGRLTLGEWRQFLGHARGSTLEMQTQLILSQRLGFGDPSALEADLALSEEVGRIINGLLSSPHQRQRRKPE